MQPSYYTYVQNGIRLFTDDLSDILDSSDIEEFTALYASRVFQVSSGEYFTFIGDFPSSVGIHSMGKDEYLIKTPKKGFFCFTIL